jgi:hypothetical protein
MMPALGGIRNGWPRSMGGALGLAALGLLFDRQRV